MRLALLRPDKIGNNFWMGSRYKFTKFFEQLFEVKLFLHRSFAKALEYNPDLYLVFGHMFNSYMFPLNTKKPYVIVEFDSYSFRNKCTEAFVEKERVKLRSAKGIIVTSPEIKDYIMREFDVPDDNIFYLPLMPGKSDLTFEPLPKRPNKTLVYMGGISQTVGVGYTAGYRYIFPHLMKFMKAGWEIHIYPAPGCVVNKYAEAGMFIHPYVPPEKLYQELSQYTAGFQGFNLTPDYVNPENIAYATAARPNKIWEYLASGIPTIGHSTGHASSLYDDYWGVVAVDLEEDMDKLDAWIDIIKEQIPYYRNLQVIEQFTDPIKEFFNECHRRNGKGVN